MRETKLSKFLRSLGEVLIRVSARARSSLEWDFEVHDLGAHRETEREKKGEKGRGKGKG